MEWNELVRGGEGRGICLLGTLRARCGDLCL